MKVLMSTPASAIGSLGIAGRTSNTTGTDSLMPARISRRRGRWTACFVVIVAGVPLGVALAPSAFGDSTSTFREAVASARSATSCQPLRTDPIVEQVAEVINRSLDDYLDHNATQVPIDDPLPGLKALGYHGSKAALIRGAGPSDADAIKGAVLEGNAAINGPPAIPNCSYRDIGISVRYNSTKSYYLTLSVLAGP